jgi:hypothetical protein
MYVGRLRDLDVGSRACVCVCGEKRSVVFWRGSRIGRRACLQWLVLSVEVKCEIDGLDLDSVHVLAVLVVTSLAWRDDAMG